MTTTQHTGRQGEEAAARWLLDHGFTLLHRNWRQGHYELDIVAARKGTLHFIVVKTRRRGEAVPPACLDLDEMQLVPSPRDDVQLVAPRSPVAFEDCKTYPAQVVDGRLFATAARIGGRRKGHGRIF